jgi:hypothetical protein
MDKTAWCVLSLVLAALSLGPSFAHALEALPRLKAWPPELWIDATVRHGQFKVFGILGGPIDLAAIASAAVLAVRLRGEAGVHAAVAAAVLLALALAAWLTIVAPANSVLAHWGAGPPPPDFARVRNRWESGHLIVAGLKAAGFVALACAVAMRRSA